MKRSLYIIAALFLASIFVCEAATEWSIAVPIGRFPRRSASPES